MANPPNENPEAEVYADLERQWDQAHENIRAAYEQREQLGTEFWSRLQQLEQQATQLGKRLDAFRNRLHPAPLPRPRLTPDPSAASNPRAVTVEQPALPYVPEDDQ